MAFDNKTGPFTFLPGNERNILLLLSPSHVLVVALVPASFKAKGGQITKREDNGVGGNICSVVVNLELSPTCCLVA